MKTKLPIALMMITLLTGCETSYGPTGEYGGFPHGGYTDSNVNANTAIVSFVGNYFTPQNDIDNYLLYRSAKVTLENGYNYFVITSTSSSCKNIEVATATTDHVTTNPPQLHRTYYSHTKYAGYSVSNTRTPRFYQFSAPCHQAQTHSATSVIKMFEGPVPAGLPRAFNAQDVIAHVGPSLF